MARVIEYLDKNDSVRIDINHKTLISAERNERYSAIRLGHKKLKANHEMQPRPPEYALRLNLREMKANA